MLSTLKYLCMALWLVACTGVKKSMPDQRYATEPHRPQIHFTPKTGWMNDPNGLVYYNGTYHLFYQFYPDSTVWGPMHWGHATSRDLMHWQHQPMALAPDSLGYIFSGSAVADVANTSGFGRNGKVPLVAIFTHHDPVGEKKGKNNFQNQSIAYSLDEGKTWTKYAGNPVIKNPGIRDFRDPKVHWNEAAGKWIMSLATLDCISFFSSPDLKNWTKESEFGKEVGAHGGVWECPDLFPLDYGGKKVWVLLVSINPGGPNGGSATQYFTGDFDGKTFTPYQTDTRWLDYGPDNYAGVTWANTGDRKIFLGWMSNWSYAQVVPTQNWRSAMTVPRELRLEKVGERFLVRSTPVAELATLAGSPMEWTNIDASNVDLSTKIGTVSGPARLQFQSGAIKDFTITLSNEVGQKVEVGYNGATNQYFIDRTASGNVGFEKSFGGRYTAPRLSKEKETDVTLVIDGASVELFADGGLSVMTAVFFPGQPMRNIRMQSPEGLRINTLQYLPLSSIYQTPASKKNP